MTRRVQELILRLPVHQSKCTQRPNNKVKINVQDYTPKLFHSLKKVLLCKKKKKIKYKINKNNEWYEFLCHHVSNIPLIRLWYDKNPITFPRISIDLSERKTHQKIASGRPVFSRQIMSFSQKVFHYNLCSSPFPWKNVSQLYSKPYPGQPS